MMLGQRFRAGSRALVERWEQAAQRDGCGCHRVVMAVRQDPVALTRDRHFLGRRAADFAAMLERHPGEDGLGLDDWAGLLIEGPRYTVVAPPGRGGSQRRGRFVTDGSGVPGLWACEARSGAARALPAPSTGLLADIVRPARSIEPDPRVAVARGQNPVPGRGAGSYTAAP